MLNYLSSFFSKQPHTQPEQSLKELPLMGFGTFIGIEEKRVEDRKARTKLTQDSIYNALAEGYRHLDLAENYGNLEAVRDALKKAFTPKDKGGLGLKRGEIWLTMKSDGPFTKQHIDALLKEVGVNYFDLFLIHHPQEICSDETSLSKSWRSLSRIEKTKLKHIGVSNFYKPHLSRLLAVCKKEGLPKPFANEFEMNLLAKNPTLVQTCKQNNIKMIAYSPLGYATAPLLLSNPSLKKVAKKVKSTPAQGELAWLMSKGIAVIPKSSKQTHLKENFKALRFIDALKAKRDLVSALDKEPDLANDGLSDTAIEAKNDGKALKWKVSFRRIK